MTRAEEIFLETRERPAGESRLAFVAAACSGDPALREAVESLLRMAEKADAFFGARDGLPGLPVGLNPAEAPGSRLGRYLLEEQIGEGGMGVVYRARQTEPVVRDVALKVIKWGLDTRQVVARFEVERQTLARMTHPNIAHVLDAGATETGRPYFVMELVSGEPITRYCDRRRLPLRGRLAMFVTVCHAVQHAHQKGVVHRDLKPSNILVVPPEVAG